MILWNPTSQKIETTFDAKNFVFLPDERKRIKSISILGPGQLTTDERPEIYISEEILAEHLLHNLSSQGLVKLGDNPTAEEIKQARITGLLELRKTCLKLGENWQTVNKERESAKLGKLMPNDAVINAAKLIKEIDAKLAEIKVDDYKDVADVFGSSVIQDTEEVIAQNDTDIEITDSSELKIKKSKKDR